MPIDKKQWDAIAVQKRWQHAEAQSRVAFDKIFPQKPPSKDSNHFYDLCLAELDGAAHLVKQPCFGSMSDFIDELKRLQNKPTSPSFPPFDLQVYIGCQKWWLDHEIDQTISEAESLEKAQKDKKERLIAIPAFIFLGIGCVLLSSALNDDQARKLGLAQWQAFVGFILCFFLFGALWKFSSHYSAKKKL